MFDTYAILIVEDEPFIALDLSIAIELCNGYVVGPFALNSEALAHIGRVRIDAAVIDGCLIDGDSHSVADALRALAIPTVFFSANGPDHPVARVHPELAVVVKPASINEVLDALAVKLENAGGGGGGRRPTSRPQSSS